MTKLTTDADIKIQENINKGKGVCIYDIPATDFYVEYDTQEKATCIFVRGCKRRTKITSLDKNILKFISHRFSIYTIGDRFNFFPVDQEKILLENADAIQQRNLEEAKEALDYAISKHENRLISKLRKSLTLKLHLKDFKFNDTSNSYVVDYDVTANLKNKDWQLKLEFSDIRVDCIKATIGKPEIFKLAESSFSGFQKTLSFEEVFPGADQLFKVSIPSVVYALIDKNKSYNSRLCYDEQNRCLKYAYQSPIVNAHDLNQAQTNGRVISHSEVFKDLQDRILKMIHNCENSSLKKCFQYAFLIAFAPENLKESLFHLRAFNDEVPTLPKSLSIHTDKHGIGWKWLEDNFDNVYKGLALSFHRYSGSIFDLFDPEDSNKYYVVPFQSKNSDRVFIYLLSLSDLIKNYVFNVAAEDTEVLMFFLWATFASNLNIVGDDSQRYSFYRFFKSLKIGTMEGSDPLYYSNGEFLLMPKFQFNGNP